MSFGRKFHKKRIAFMIINNEIIFLENSAMSHFEWYTSLNLKKEDFKNIVRGYIMDSRAVFYKGDFIYDDEVIEKAKEYGEIIKKKYNIKKLKISAGLKKGEKGEIWSSIMKVEEWQ